MPKNTFTLIVPLTADTIKQFDSYPFDSFFELEENIPSFCLKLNNFVDELLLQLLQTTYCLTVLLRFNERAFLIFKLKTTCISSAYFDSISVVEDSHSLNAKFKRMKRT